MHRALPILLACSIPLQLAAQSDIGNIRLIVQLTVDGMRGDLLTRYRPSFGPDGFNRLLDNGVWYTNAHHLHANTETIVGHATLATGAHPSEHGMVGNVWLNRATGKLGYNIEDRKSPTCPCPVSAVTESNSIPRKPSRRLAGDLRSTFWPRHSATSW